MWARRDHPNRAATVDAASHDPPFSTPLRQCAPRAVLRLSSRRSSPQEPHEPIGSPAQGTGGTAPVIAGGNQRQVRDPRVVRARARWPGQPVRQDVQDAGNMLDEECRLQAPGGAGRLSRPPRPSAHHPRIPHLPLVTAGDNWSSAPSSLCRAADRLVRFLRTRTTTAESENSARCALAQRRRKWRIVTAASTGDPAVMRRPPPFLFARYMR